MKQETPREVLYRRQLNAMSLLLAILMIMLIFAFKMIIDVTASKEEQTHSNVVDEVVQEYVQEVDQEEKEVSKQDVYFTSYYVGDGSSTNKTGSGITIDKFYVNELGWYTFNDRVVLACATYQGLNSKFGVLKNYMQQEQGITYYNYFDEISIEVNGKEYEAIVLDTCGASHDKDYLEKYDDGLNRIDIFVSSKDKQVYKVKGSVIHGV